MSPGLGDVFSWNHENTNQYLYNSLCRYDLTGRNRVLSQPWRCPPRSQWDHQRFSQVKANKMYWSQLSWFMYKCLDMSHMCIGTSVQILQGVIRVRWCDLGAGVRTGGSGHAGHWGISSDHLWIVGHIPSTPDSSWLSNTAGNYNVLSTKRNSQSIAWMSYLEWDCIAMYRWRQAI